MAGGGNCHAGKSESEKSSGNLSMATNHYYELIETTFEQVESVLEALPDDVDIRGAEGVINVTFENGVVFVLSRQPPTEQLWLATPGGGFHYAWREDGWIDTKTGEIFETVLARELAEHTGLALDWNPSGGTLP
jgi:CyaY protein